MPSPSSWGGRYRRTQFRCVIVALTRQAKVRGSIANSPLAEQEGEREWLWPDDRPSALGRSQAPPPPTREHLSAANEYRRVKHASANASKAVIAGW
jgi:hypothetical protein